MLASSSALNAAYFLPILHRAWFRKPAGPWQERLPAGRTETAWMLLAPPVVTAAFALVLGLFANMGASALDWSRFIADLEYGR